MSIYHPTADEVYEYIKDNGLNIGKATVYRILNRMVEENEILHLSMPIGPDRFDATVSEHQHFECKVCKKIFDIDIPELSEIDSRLKSELGYSVENHNIIFEGICPECSAKINKCQ